MPKKRGNNEGTIVRRAVGHVLLKDLRPEQLQWLYNEKIRSGLAARSVRLIHAVVHGALAQAMKNGLVARNVSEATSRPSGPRPEMTPLDLNQVKALLASCEKDRLFAAFLLEFATGLRRGELLGLRWQDVDMKAGLVSIRQTLLRLRGQPKSRLVFQEPKTPLSRRTIPITPAVLESLKRHKAAQAQEKLLCGGAYQDHGLVFCQPHGHPFDPLTFTRHFKRLLARAGLPPVRFHDARHTFATLMLELGEHPKVVQTMLGHSKISLTLDLYSHVSVEMERRAAQRLTAAFYPKKQGTKERGL